MLDVVDAMSAHYHEHHQELMAWPWRLYCAKWARMLIAFAKEEKRKKEREIEAEQKRLARDD